MPHEINKKLEGKVALVTGGNSGIGLATAKLFTEHGAKVIITVRSNESFAKAKKEYGNVFDVIQTDVSSLSDLDRLYESIKSKYGVLDIVFANAGIATPRPAKDVDSEFYEMIMNTDVKGVFFTVLKALPLLNEGSSVIVNGSIASERGIPGSVVYSAAKAAVRSFVRTWTAEIPPSQVRFNVVAPGITGTGLAGEMFQGQEHAVVSTIPAKRMGTPQEIANVVLFLASSDSSFICGASIDVDGGTNQV